MHAVQPKRTASAETAIQRSMAGFAHATVPALPLKA
jgi:hypothetical protein